MAGFTIPNTPDAYNQNQAEPDSLDFQILGNHTNAVVTGAEVTPGPSGATVAVSAGEVIVGGVHYPVSASASLALTAYASSPFFDIVVARLSSGSISLTVLAGTSGANPVYPAITANDVVLAAVWRPANTTPTSGMIVDKRLMSPTTTNRVSSGTPSAGTGNNGETHVNSSWTSDATLASPLSVKVGGTWYQLARYSSNFTAGTITANLTGNVTGNVTGTAGAVAWANVTGKPTNFVYSDNGTYSLNITGSAGSAGSATTAGTSGGFYNRPTLTRGVDIEVGDLPYNEVLSLRRSNLTPSGFHSFAVRPPQGGDAIMFVDVLGRVAGTGTYLNLSDREEKHDIVVADVNYLSTAVDGLIPKSFVYNRDETNDAQLGFIAQDVQEVLPEAVAPFGGKLGLKDGVIVTALVAKVQQLSARLDALEAGNG